jgi:hypothetical protein
VTHLEVLAEQLGMRRGLIQATDDDYEDQGGEVMQYITAYMLFTTGIFLTAVRLCEPLFRLIIVKQTYEFMGILYDDENRKEKARQLETDTLNAFLNSSLNVELVYVILFSITTFAKNSKEVSAKNKKKNKKQACDEVEPVNLEEPDLVAKMQ